MSGLLSTHKENCPICLDTIDQKSFADGCFHTFCFQCLLEWSAVKAVCPLCKKPFSSIIHNVRANDVYQQHFIKQPSPPLDSQQAQPRFRYRTTLDNARLTLQRARAFTQHIAAVNAASLPSSNFSRDARLRVSSLTCPNQPPSSLEVRRNVYRSNKWVKGENDSSAQRSRVRCTSPEFFKAHPACRHRLGTWLHRELKAAMVNPRASDVEFVIELILNLIAKTDIKGSHFRNHLRPFLGSRTEHFIHEFYHYACSPYSMITYDRHAVYEDLPATTSPRRLDDSDDDCIILESAPPPPPIVIDDDDDEDDDVYSTHYSRRLEATPGHSSWETPWIGSITGAATPPIQHGSEAHTLKYVEADTANGCDGIKVGNTDAPLEPKDNDDIVQAFYHERSPILPLDNSSSPDSMKEKLFDFPSEPINVDDSSDCAIISSNIPNEIGFGIGVNNFSGTTSGNDVSRNREAPSLFDHVPSSSEEKHHHERHGRKRKNRKHKSKKKSSKRRKTKQSDLIVDAIQCYFSSSSSTCSDRSSSDDSFAENKSDVGASCDIEKIFEDVSSTMCHKLLTSTHCEALGNPVNNRRGSYDQLEDVMRKRLKRRARKHSH